MLKIEQIIELYHMTKGTWPSDAETFRAKVKIPGKAIEKVKFRRKDGVITALHRLQTFEVEKLQ